MNTGSGESGALSVRLLGPLEVSVDEVPGLVDGGQAASLTGGAGAVGGPGGVGRSHGRGGLGGWGRTRQRPSGWLEESEAPSLLERYLTALEWRLDLDISAGRHRELVVELTARYPLRESLWARLLIALDRSGRRADALALYETIRARIAAQLGVDPDPTLQRIHADLLGRRNPAVGREEPRRAEVLIQATGSRG